MLFYYFSVFLLLGSVVSTHVILYFVLNKEDTREMDPRNYLVNCSPKQQMYAELIKSIEMGEYLSAQDCSMQSENAQRRTFE